MAASEIYRSDRVTALQSKIVYHSAIMQMSKDLGDGGTILKNAMETVQHLDDEVKRHLQPWDSPEELAKQMANARRSSDDLVKHAIGDMNDPEFRRKFNATINNMYAGMGAPPEEDEFIAFRENREKLVKLREQQWGMRP